MSVKLTIKAYSDNSFSSEKGEFVSTINPSNLKIISDLLYGDNQLFHNNNWLLKYKKSQPRRLVFSLIFDSTGIFQDSKVAATKRTFILAEIKVIIDEGQSIIDSLSINSLQDIEENPFIDIIGTFEIIKGNGSFILNDITLE